MVFRRSPFSSHSGCRHSKCHVGILGVGKDEIAGPVGVGVDAGEFLVQRLGGGHGANLRSGVSGVFFAAVVVLVGLRDRVLAR